MQNLQALLSAVGDVTLDVRPGAALPKTLWVIEFLSAEAQKRSDAVYLVDEAQLSALAEMGPLPAAVYFVACAGEAAPPLPPEIPEAAAVVFVREALLPLYARLSRCLDTQRVQSRVDDIIMMAENIHYGPEQLVVAMSQMLSVGIYILNPAYQRIAGLPAELSRHPVVQELASAGALSPARVRAIRSGAEEGVMLHEGVSGAWARYNILLLWQPGARIDPEYLCRRLAEYAAAYRDAGAPPEIPPFLIDQRLNRILEGKTVDEAEIRAFFGLGSTPTWFAVLVLGYEQGMRWSAEAYQRQARLLRTAFRSASVTVIRSQVCAVVQMPVRSAKENVYSRTLFSERAYSEGWDAERLSGALQQCGVYLCRSSVFQSLRFFPVEYSMLTDVLDIAIPLDGCRGRRIIAFRDYSAIVSIKYAVERFLQKNEPYAVRAVMVPELVTLLMHDFRNNTDLAEVLFRYYIYGDVNQTAQSLFVHRNTVYNKLKTIQKLLDVDLDDPTVRGSYLTSLQVYYYCEKCLGLDLHTIE